MLQPINNVPGQKRGGAGRKRNVNPGRARMLYEFEQVWPLDGIAAGEYEYGHLPGRNLVDELLSFGGAQLRGVALGLRGGPAMHTGEIARLGDFPNGNEGALIEIDGLDLRVHGTITAGSR